MADIELPRPLYALTLYRPWCWAIVAGHKPIENRPWAPGYHLQRQLFAIHSGNTWDAEGAAWLRDTMGLPVPEPADWPAGRICGVVRYVDLRISGLNPDPGPYFFGPYGWVLAEPRQFDGPRCRGWQKLWRVEGELRAAVEAAARG